MVIEVPKVIFERVKKEAEKLGISLEEYIVELLSQDLNPRDRAKEYVEASKELLTTSEKEIAKSNVRQAAEKIWGACALAVKAYAYWREERRLASHRELWEYSKIVARELGNWVLEIWNQASGMHTCFYDEWCSREHVETALRAARKLIETISEKITKE